MYAVKYPAHDPRANDPHKHDFLDRKRRRRPRRHLRVRPRHRSIGVATLVRVLTPRARSRRTTRRRARHAEGRDRLRSPRGRLPRHIRGVGGRLDRRGFQSTLLCAAHHRGPGGVHNASDSDSRQWVLRSRPDPDAGGEVADRSTRCATRAVALPPFAAPIPARGGRTTARPPVITTTSSDIGDVGESWAIRSVRRRTGRTMTRLADCLRLRPRIHTLADEWQRNDSGMCAPAARRRGCSYPPGLVRPLGPARRDDPVPRAWSTSTPASLRVGIIALPDGGEWIMSRRTPRAAGFWAVTRHGRASARRMRCGRWRDAAAADVSPSISRSPTRQPAGAYWLGDRDGELVSA